MTTAAIDLLTQRAFPDLAAAVRAVIPSTAATWEHAVRETLPTADRLTMEQLRDDLPALLKLVADALESKYRFATERLEDAAPKHGAVRFDQGFKFDELLIECGILRETLVTQLTSHLARNLEIVEVLALGAALDVTIRGVAGRFVEHLTGQLKAATEAQSKYLSFLSHDLRGGLNGVFLMIEVLKRELAGEARLAETVADLDTMRRSLLETIATMDRFLYAERFRKGKVQLRPEALSLHRLLNETAAHFSYQARHKGIDIRIEVPPEADIVSDRELLTLIFQNLLSNALKYTTPKTPIVIAGIKSAQSCTISVIDQGPGIAPERLSELFDPFTRGETHGEPGVGLGLSIARQAAQYLNAKLWAESELGKGAKFNVELPLEMKKP